MFFPKENTIWDGTNVNNKMKPNLLKMRKRYSQTMQPKSEKTSFHIKHRVNSFLVPHFTPALPVHILLTKTWAFSTRNSNLWLETNLDKSELYHTRQEPQTLLRGSSHFKASFHLNTNRVNNWQSAKQIPSSFPFLMACSSPPPHPPHSHSSFSALLSGDAPTL